MLMSRVFFLLVASWIVFHASMVHARPEQAYLDLFYQNELLLQPPQFIASVKPHKHYTPYYVEYNFENEKCTIFHSPQSFDPELVEFAIYHEAAHCMLYQKGLIYTNAPELYDLLLADSLVFQQERKMGYMYFHELYADALASALLLKKNPDDPHIARLMRMREASPFSAHQTPELLQAIVQRDWRSMSYQELEQESSRMTEDYFLNAWVKRYFFNEHADKTIASITQSLIRSFWQSWSQRSVWSKEEQEFFSERLTGFSSHMANPGYRLLQSMYHYRCAMDEAWYLQRVNDNLAHTAKPLLQGERFMSTVQSSEPVCQP